MLFTLRMVPAMLEARRTSKRHYYSMGKSDIMSKFQCYILEYSPNSLKWTSAVETPNYVSEFYKANPHFSTQDLRIEQILLTFT